MQELARTIACDALENHKVADPAGHVCDRLNLRDGERCTLARFIDEYNWLAIYAQSGIPRSHANLTDRRLGEPSNTFDSSQLISEIVTAIFDLPY